MCGCVCRACSRYATNPLLQRIPFESLWVVTKLLSQSWCSPLMQPCFDMESMVTDCSINRSAEAWAFSTAFIKYVVTAGDQVIRAFVCVRVSGDAIDPFMVLRLSCERPDPPRCLDEPRYWLCNLSSAAPHAGFTNGNSDLHNAATLQNEKLKAHTVSLEVFS